MKPLFTNTGRPIHEAFPKCCQPFLKCLSGTKEEQNDNTAVSQSFPYCLFILVYDKCVFLRSFKFAKSSIFKLFNSSICSVLFINFIIKSRRYGIKKLRL